MNEEQTPDMDPYNAHLRHTAANWTQSQLLTIAPLRIPIENDTFPYNTEDIKQHMEEEVWIGTDNVNGLEKRLHGLPFMSHEEQHQEARSTEPFSPGGDYHMKTLLATRPEYIMTRTEEIITTRRRHTIDKHNHSRRSHRITPKCDINDD